MDNKSKLKQYPVNCDIKIKEEPIEETTESNNIPNISIKKEYPSENEDESDSGNGSLVIKQEFGEESDDYPIGNLKIKLEDIPFVNQNQKLAGIKQNTEGIFQCDICPYAAADKTYLPIHKKIHRTSLQGCDKCFYICGTLTKLKHHKRKKHMKEEDLRHHCKDCSFSTLILRHLKIHRQENHKRELINGKIKCEFCIYRGNASSMKKHIAKFHQQLTLCSEAV